MAAPDWRSPVLLRDPTAVTRRLAEETVILPIRNTVADLTAIYTLNETGSFVWDRLDGAHSVGDVVTDLIAAFEVEVAEAQRTVLDLIADLRSEGLVREKQN